MKHKAIRVENLMYNGCEPHWKCVNCGVCVPFHCYSKQEFEQQECAAPANKQQVTEILTAAIRRLKRTQKFLDSESLKIAIVYAEKALEEVKGKEQ